MRLRPAAAGASSARPGAAVADAAGAERVRRCQGQVSSLCTLGMGRTSVRHRRQDACRQQMRCLEAARRHRRADHLRPHTGLPRTLAAVAVQRAGPAGARRARVGALPCGAARACSCCRLSSANARHSGRRLRASRPTRRHRRAASACHTRLRRIRRSRPPRSPPAMPRSSSTAGGGAHRRLAAARLLCAYTRGGDTACAAATSRSGACAGGGLAPAGACAPQGTRRRARRARRALWKLSCGAGCTDGLHGSIRRCAECASRAGGGCTSAAARASKARAEQAGLACRRPLSKSVFTGFFFF